MQDIRVRVWVFGHEKLWILSLAFCMMDVCSCDSIAPRSGWLGCKRQDLRSLCGGKQGSVVSVRASSYAGMLHYEWHCTQCMIVDVLSQLLWAVSQNICVPYITTHLSSYFSHGLVTIVSLLASHVTCTNRLDNHGDDVSGRCWWVANLRLVTCNYVSLF